MDDPRDEEDVNCVSIQMTSRNKLFFYKCWMCLKHKDYYAKFICCEKGFERRYCIGCCMRSSIVVQPCDTCYVEGQKNIFVSEYVNDWWDQFFEEKPAQKIDPLKIPVCRKRSRCSAAHAFYSSFFFKGRNVNVEEKKNFTHRRTHLNKCHHY